MGSERIKLQLKGSPNSKGIRSLKDATWGD